jgi:hypothetical protein
MRSLIAALAGLTLSLSAAHALADPAPSAKPSVESTPIGDLVANDKTKAVLAKDMPGLLTYEGLDQIKGMTLRDISKFPEANLDDTKLAAMQKDFDAIP